MGVAIVPWDAETAARKLTLRRRWRIAGGICLAACAVSIVADQVWVGKSAHDDWSRFDGAHVRLIHVIDAQSIAVCQDRSDESIDVRLIDVRSFSRANVAALNDALAGRQLTLHVNGAQTRDERGRLMAEATTDDGKSISTEMISLERPSASARRKSEATRKVK
jgi:hypothetical protein